MSEYCHVTLRVTLVVIIFVLVSVYLIVACNIPGASPGSSAGKESSCNAGDPGSIPGSGRSSGRGHGNTLQYSWASLVAQIIKNLPAMQESCVQSLGWEDPLEEGMATHSSTLAQRIPMERGASLATVRHVVTKSWT